MITVALNQLALADPALVALIGDRLCPGRLPQNTAYPAVTWAMADAPRHEWQGGKTQLVSARILCQCWAKGYTAAKATAAALREAVHRKAGTYDGTRVLSISLLDETDAAEPPTLGDDAGVDCVTLLFRVWYEE